MIFTEVNIFNSIASSTLKGLSLNKWGRDFLFEIFMLYLCIPGRINFKQMSRYSKHCEQRFRNQFEEKFDSMPFNFSLITPHIGKRIAISFDPSYIEKSGNLNRNVFTQIQINDNTQAFYVVVNSKSLKTDILLVVEGKTEKNGKNDTTFDILHGYPNECSGCFSAVSLLFSNGMEFNFRDAKLSTGLNHSQVRDLDKLYFHFNASHTTVNIAKIIHLSNKKNAELPFSIANYKLLVDNAFMLNRFIEAFGVKPKTLKSHHLVKELLYFGMKAA